MNTVRYQRWDVFTNTQLAGNQLAVVPDAASLDTPTMQRIANEFALPETTFVEAPTDSSCGFRLRIFTPERELPMAGHPTIGTTFALARLGRITGETRSLLLQLGIGPTRIELDWGDRRLSQAWMTQRIPELGPQCQDAEALARVLRLGEGDLLAPLYPAQVLSSGIALLFVPLASRAAVDRASLNRSELANLCASLNIAECPVYVFSVAAHADDVTSYSRMFAPVLGINEDPATGGASGPLGWYLATHWPQLLREPAPLVNAQGVKMGRPSRILIAVSGWNSATPSLKVGGEAVYLGQGEIDLAPPGSPPASR